EGGGGVGGGRGGGGVGAAQAGGEVERPGKPRGDRADVPHSGRAVVNALARRGGDEGQPRRQQVAHLDPGGVIRAEVGQCDREGDGVAHIGRGGADRLAEGQV